MGAGGTIPYLSVVPLARRGASPTREPHLCTIAKSEYGAVESTIQPGSALDTFIREVRESIEQASTMDELLRRVSGSTSCTTISILPRARSSFGAETSRKCGETGSISRTERSDVCTAYGSESRQQFPLRTEQMIDYDRHEVGNSDLS